MPEPDSIEPTMDANRAPQVAAGRNVSVAHGDVGFPGTTGPEAGADWGSPAADPGTSPEQSPARVPAVRVGRYPVLGELGRGGMGAVVLSRDPELGRDLALKVLLGDVPRPEVVQRFREEAQVGAQRLHPVR